MKHLKLLMVGILCLAAIGLAHVVQPKKVFGDGIKPVDTSKDPLPPPCDCVCTSFTLGDYGQATEYPQVPGHVYMSGQYTTDKNCEVKAILTCATVDSNGNVGNPQYCASSTMFGTPGSFSCSGFPPTPAYGYALQVYLVRVCDNTIIGWSDVVYVAAF